MADVGADGARVGQTALLRAMLNGDESTHGRLAADLERRGATDGLGVLVAAAFAVALRRHFSTGYTTADVIRLVAQIRAGNDQAATQIDPAGAEQLVLAALGQPISMGRVDDLTKGAIQAAGLAYLAGGHRFSDDQLGAFLAEAQRQAGWLPHPKT